jgi:DnaK suppressor protein
MSEPQHEHFRNILDLWMNQLVEGAKDTVSHMQDDVDNFADPLDRARQEEEFSLELRTRDRERKLIKKIEETLERIASGDYGYCEKCGAEIGIGRLEVRPTADLCIDCKTVAEILEKQTGE